MYKHLNINTIAIALNNVEVSRFLSVILIINSRTRTLIITTIKVLNMLGFKNIENLVKMH